MTSPGGSSAAMTSPSPGDSPSGMTSCRRVTSSAASALRSARCRLAPVNQSKLLDRLIDESIDIENKIIKPWLKAKYCPRVAAA